MPYPNVPKSLTKKMDRCVEKVMAKGKAKKNAIAICHNQIVGKGIGDAAKRRKGG